VLKTPNFNDPDYNPINNMLFFAGLLWLALLASHAVRHYDDIGC